MCLFVFQSGILVSMESRKVQKQVKQLWRNTKQCKWVELHPDSCLLQFSLQWWWKVGTVEVCDPCDPMSLDLVPVDLPWLLRCPSSKTRKMMGALVNVRRGGRSQPLLMVALVACILLFGFNYWVSSSRNVELQVWLVWFLTWECVSRISAEKFVSVLVYCMKSFFNTNVNCVSLTQAVCRCNVMWKACWSGNTATVFVLIKTHRDTRAM